MYAIKQIHLTDKPSQPPPQEADITWILPNNYANNHISSTRPPSPPLHPTSIRVYTPTDQILLLIDLPTAIATGRSSTQPIPIRKLIQTRRPRPLHALRPSSNGLRIILQQSPSIQHHIEDDQSDPGEDRHEAKA